MSSNPDEPKSRARTDFLRRKVSEADPGSGAPGPGEKFFGNFPDPYMNGLLHRGHAFSLSKLEFGSAYHRLRGSNVLLPFAFHCTGMPIKASADKLDREIQQYMEILRYFPRRRRSDAVAPDKFKGKKSKAATKAGAQKYQWEIVRSFGLEGGEIAKFQDPYHWLTHFPTLAKEVLKKFGLGCDWRRSFVTTDMNPYYDAFVKWQMRKLKKLGKVVKDMRYTIYSPLDGQPCADHDRAIGEGVQPQEYVLIKMKVISPFPPRLKALEGRKVYLAAATLRPETMYGQTNCWVLPDGVYGAFEINDTDVFILTARAALNLAYQHLSRVPEKPTCLCELSGNDLIGLALKSPLAFNETMYAFPMLTVLTDKGTGIVTSVPSDSPDDFMALQDLVTKPPLRAKYGLKDEWVLPYKVRRVCHDLKIKSQNDKAKLAEAKRMTYLKGFTDGTMIVGEFSGRKVQEAKPLIKTKLLEEGTSVLYSDPEKKLMSRSGDECVVALTDQWYITCGETEWKLKAVKCLSGINIFSAETRNGFEHTLGWLNQWACSRSFGLGTRIPWDEQFLVESLSDSTLYMAYYTVSHVLQNGNMYGKEISSIKPEEMTDDVWDYVFCDGPAPKSDIPPTLLNKMKQEFQYWYPFDIGDALKSGFYDLQLARDEYRLSCGASGMNHDLLWRFMDVQTRLITPICPHYAEYVWQKILKKEGFAIKAGWPVADTPDLTLRIANKYLQDSIVSMRKLLQKQESGSKKPKKGAAPALPSVEKKDDH
uniref:leucine--tRNA ligase n=1 Tax=Setaria viridis TaxID=4556 RepID=A0A4U6VGL0_SETVI|nr:hypothetical protein SEVIR_3G346600v2 [Setaria viridis]